MASSLPLASTWKSPLVPNDIRRPWDIFDEDLDWRFGDEPLGSNDFDPGEGESAWPAEIGHDLQLERQLHLELQSEGSLAVFLRLPEVLQRYYAEVSIMELAAFVSWRRSQAGRQAQIGGSCRKCGSDSGGDSADELLEDWDLMDGCDKADLVPEDARATLASEPDGRWMPLLGDGLPPCVAAAHLPLPAPLSPDVALADVQQASAPAAKDSVIVADAESLACPTRSEAALAYNQVQLIGIELGTGASAPVPAEAVFNVNKAPTEVLVGFFAKAAMTPVAPQGKRRRLLPLSHTSSTSLEKPKGERRKLRPLRHKL